MELNAPGFNSTIQQGRDVLMDRAPEQPFGLVEFSTLRVCVEGRPIWIGVQIQEKL
jgi:hypothetical protein